MPDSNLPAPSTSPFGSSRFVYYACGLFAALLVFVAEFNTVLNDLYETGSSVFDATIFGTVIWRSGWALHLAPLFDSSAFYDTHVSPVFYVPDALSYLFPGDRIAYFALVYSLVYASLTLVAYRLMAALMKERYSCFAAAVAALLLFCSQHVFGAAFQPHMEVASPIFGLLMFRAWQMRRYGWAGFWLIVNAAIREDIGAIFAVPLLGLALVQYLECRSNDPEQAKERLRYGLLLAFIGIAGTVAAFTLQYSLYPPFRLVHDLYFPADHPFEHLNAQLITDRLQEIFQHRQGLWGPLVVLILAAAWLRDPELLLGAVGFLPYFLINFLSKNDDSATMTAYKPFPFVVMLFMPALVAMVRPALVRRRYAIVQWLVLLCAVVPYAPGQIDAAKERWLPHPLTYSAAAYREFGERELPALLTGEGMVRADTAVEALYPYQMQSWYNWDIAQLKEEDADKVKTLIGFQNGDYTDEAKKLLARHPFTITNVSGTKLFVARRNP